MQHDPEHPLQGASRQNDGSVVWRVWAPRSRNVRLAAFFRDGRRDIDMERLDDGYFACRLAEAAEGLPYAYAFDDGREYPDPASRWQPEGVGCPSAVFFPETFAWSDADWRGVARESLAIYELHVGAFTPEGTFDAIVPRLPQLAELGITAIELMPVAQFSGDRNWGYDGVHPYAVQNSYGGPRALQRLVDAAHRCRLAVILDVVYNHLGPEGNFLGKFGPYFTDRYHTPWGNAINFDGAESDAVRAFFIHNARAWVRDFHIDGLRLDAVETMYDFGACHILADIQEAVQEEAAQAGRTVHVIAESDQNDLRLIRPRQRGGYGLDGVWADDFHHSVHALLTGHRAGYYMDYGRPAHLAKAIRDVFVYDGCYSRHRRHRYGSRAGKTERSHFVVCVQNHDQVGNNGVGNRLATLLPPPAWRLVCGLLLLSPCTPLLFMGEEYGEDRPFPFFCSFAEPALVEAVRQGRAKDVASMWHPQPVKILDPQARETFAAAKLSWAWPPGTDRAGLRLLYRDLLAARRQWPALADRAAAKARLVDSRKVRGPGGEPALLEFTRGGGAGLLVLANLTSVPLSLRERVGVRGHRRGSRILEASALPTSPHPNPLPKGEGDLRSAICETPLLSTEAVRYGGQRRPDQSADGWLPYELMVFDRSGGRR